MIYKVELALSNRARCKRCKEKILNEEPRGVECGGGFYCFRCFSKELKLQIKEISNMKKKFKILMNKSKKQMILNRL